MLKKLKDRLRTRRGKKAVWLLAALLLITAGLTVSARTWLSSRTIAEGLAVPAAPGQSSLPIPEPERGVIRLLTNGFSPTEISGTSGQYRLVMTRMNQNEEIILQLKKDTGELVQEIEMPQEKVDWTTLIELQAGSYKGTVVNHPEWVCHIIIQ